MRTRGPNMTETQKTNVIADHRAGMSYADLARKYKRAASGLAIICKRAAPPPAPPLPKAPEAKQTAHVNGETLGQIVSSMAAAGEIKRTFTIPVTVTIGT